MADDKKLKMNDALYYIGITAAAAAFCFFGYMKLTDTELFIFDRIIGCYTICFTAVLSFLVIRVMMIYSKSKKFAYQTILMIIAAVVAAVCLINSIAEDSRKSKTKDVLNIVEGTDVFLCEDVEKSGHTRIDVYRVRNRLAKKIGEIDERYFSVRCVEEDTYTYNVSDDYSIININCHYGTYGNDMISLNPAFDTGVMTFSFVLD